ncbi:pyruvate kinase [Flavobacteriaceae bacterium GF1]
MKIEQLVEELGCVQRAILYGQSKIDLPKGGLHGDYVQSAANLFHYLVLRSFDLRPYQDALSELGLSSIRTAEGYVLQNLNNVIHNLQRISGSHIEVDFSEESFGYQESRNLLNRHIENLFGSTDENAKTKVMVTLPTAAAFDVAIVRQMAENGMDVARINLGHDNETIWKAMVHNVRTVSKSLGKSIKIYMDLAGPKIRTGAISLSDKKRKGKGTKKMILRQGERLILTKLPVSVPTSKFNKKGKQVRVAELNVSLPQIIDDVRLGDPILFDDGMIKGLVVDKDEDGITIEIVKCFKPKLGLQKGINLPHTKLNLPALTENDMSVLPFACAHADILGYSFVRSDSDVQILYDELEALNAKDIGVVFKIENQEAFENFPSILIKGMERSKIGVMIARGDLAVEMGFERISEVQKELLWICEAAHIPVIWATQVLETLAKKGIPTRAEISDAAEGARAECVMLNKGPHINQAIATLRAILDKMDGHMSKKKESLRALNVAKKYMEWQDQEVNQIY